MHDEHNLASGHAEGIFGDVTYDPPRPRKKDFLPWHRPRKQYVRHYQWYAEIKALLDDGGCEGDTLRYLGLPGMDLLDLRYFHSEICEPRQQRLRYLGFNSGVHPDSDEAVELNISRDEVSKLGFIDPRSQIIADDFRAVAGGDSVAWARAHELGPYHVINLDLCNGFGRDVPGVLEDTHYNALNRLFSLQARSKDSWLLLLTTRAGKEHIHAVVLKTLLHLYTSNLSACPPFHDESRKLFRIGNGNNDTSPSAAVATSDGLLAVFLVGLCKWLGSLAINQRPTTEAKIRSVVGYRVWPRAEREDLISLAVRFSPSADPVPDSAGLAQQTAQVPDDCALATEAAKWVAGLQNVDDILAANVHLHEQMVKATVSLLESARYDIGAYQDWLVKSGAHARGA